MAINLFSRKKRKQFNQMYEALRCLVEDYASVCTLTAASEARYNMPANEAIKHAYENMRNDARKAIHNVRPFKE